MLHVMLHSRRTLGQMLPGQRQQNWALLVAAQSRSMADTLLISQSIIKSLLTLVWSLADLTSLGTAAKVYKALAEAESGPWTGQSLHARCPGRC